jgi:glutamine synthetase
MIAVIAGELEFCHYRAPPGVGRAPEPVHRVHADHDILTAGLAESLLAAIRAAMAASGLEAVATHGEGGAGRFEINLAPAPPLATADRHAIFKHLVKATVRHAGAAVTFMAKPHADQAGSGCHLHLSIRDRAGASALGVGGNLSPWGGAFLAGLLAHAGSFMPLHAPYANSYRSFRPGSYVPLDATPGRDNRTVMVRALDGPDGVRLEFRLPGADANPYHAMAAALACGLAGVNEGLAPPAPVPGDATRLPPDPLPRDLTEALAAFAASAVARDALGAEVHGHLLALAARKRDAGRLAVTDWDLARGFDAA